LPERTCESETRRGVEHHVDLPGHQVLHGQAGAAIRHHLEAGADGVLKEDAADVAGGTHAGVALRDLVRVGLQPGDEPHEIVRRHGFLGHDQERLGRDQRNGFEVLQQVELEGIDRAARDVGPPLADAEGVAVGRRARDTADTDGAARAGDVLDDDGLAEGGAHALGHDARDHVG
jgi:hypothetical protein